MTVQANILDAIHDELPSSVWDDPGSPAPHLKPQHRKWIQRTVGKVLKGAGYTHMDDWLSLVLTGSLTTYQYGKESDCDVSLFVDTEHFPEWSRAEMIGLMISHVDGTTLPGTTFPMQCFVVPPDVRKQDLYKPGLRSGYDLASDQWIEPPDPSRVHDVQREYNDMYIYALEQADKMERLLRYEPDKAKMLWHQIHQRRRRDQMAGKGDYSESNIVYKFLANRGLFPAISEATGEYIAKQAKPEARTVAKFVYDPVANHLVLGEMAKEEGEALHHAALVEKSGLDPKNLAFGQFSPEGHIETFARPRIRGFGQPEMNQYAIDHRLRQALGQAVPGLHYESDPLYQKWDLDGPPQITYMGNPPTVTSDANNQSPSEKGIWQF